MLCIPPPVHEPPEEVTRAALHTLRKWQRGQVVHVRFLEGDPVVWQRVAAIVTGPEGWNSACGLQFLFDQAEGAEVRIAFAPGGSWSHLGDYRNAPLPTMNFGWLTRDTPHEEMRRVVLHEFGHALGLVHEHAVPWAAIPWDRDAVYAYYQRVMGWSPAQVEAQVLAPTAREVLSSGGYDGRSIMLYYIPAELVRDRKARGGNTQLSKEDRRMAARWYGPPPLQFSEPD